MPDWQELHTDDKAILVAVGASAFCAGLFGFYEDHQVLGTVFGLGGLVIMAPASQFVRSYTPWIFGRPSLWAVTLATWLLLAAEYRIEGMEWVRRMALAPLRSDKRQIDSTPVKAVA
jgi:hypothetical protein